MSNEASADNAASSAAPDKSETTFMQKIRQIMPTFMNKPPRAVVKTPSQKKEELIEELQNQLTFKTVEIATLKTELNRYQAALDLKSAGRANRAHELDCIREDGFPRQRAIGVSAEPETTKTAKDERLKKYSKSASYVLKHAKLLPRITLLLQKEKAVEEAGGSFVSIRFVEV
ncbi:unnamed protein product [Schistocephalus solidus]|uniref:Chromatin modification-related protein EAF6 n=1 Tax=Schistocephalus solidus TaxID=70667 RepID=A0A183SPG5_SCHSO|nr:unnamed protein product [Schistocephalus solidus]